MGNDEEDGEFTANEEDGKITLKRRNQTKTVLVNLYHIFIYGLEFIFSFMVKSSYLFIFLLDF